MLGALIVLGVLGGFAWIGTRIVASARRASQERNDLLAALARFLGGTSQPGDNRATGNLHGIATSFELATRGSGSDRESWTEVECALPRGYPLSLDVRHHGWFDRGRIERGTLVDVVIGDPEFDEKFLVEGAPADIVRRLLDAQTRAYLLAQRLVTLETREGGLLRLSIRNWIEDEAVARAALEHTATLAAAVRAATAAADDAVAVDQTDSPYRPMVDDAPVREARATREAEVADLEARRKARADRQKMIVVVFVIGFVVIWLLAVLGD